jgi:hypothetical protein
MARNIPKGKGIFIWYLFRAGTPGEAAAKAVKAGIRWVAIKMQNGMLVADGRSQSTFNAQDPEAYVKAFKDAGVAVYGWPYLYGSSTYLYDREVEASINAINRFQVDGWLLDIEGQWEDQGKAGMADGYCTRVRAAIPDTVGFGLCSYRFPSLHASVPWAAFLKHMDFHAPQVYWVGSHNPAVQLQRSIKELQAIKKLPFVPVGSAYAEGKWAPTVEDINAFYGEVIASSCPAWSWWEWKLAYERPEWWDAISAQASPDVEEPPVVVDPPSLEQRVTALEQRVTALEKKG